MRKRAFEERMRTGQVSAQSIRQQRRERREREKKEKKKNIRKKKKNDCQQCLVCKQRFKSREKLIVHLSHAHKGDLIFN